MDTEFDLTPGWCLWQDQVIFFNMTHAAIKFNFELEEGFTFCVTDTEDKGRKCGPWNTLCTKKLKEVVVSARTTSKGQSSKEGERLQDIVFKDSLSSRPLTLRPIYWEISSDTYTCCKMGKPWVKLSTVTWLVNLMRFLESVWLTKRNDLSPYTSRTEDTYTNIQTCIHFKQGAPPPMGLQQP